MNPLRIDANYIDRPKDDTRHQIKKPDHYRAARPARAAGRFGPRWVPNTPEAPARSSRPAGPAVSAWFTGSRWLVLAVRFAPVVEFDRECLVRSRSAGRPSAAGPAVGADYERL